MLRLSALAVAAVVGVCSAPLQVSLATHGGDPDGLAYLARFSGEIVVYGREAGCAWLRGRRGERDVLLWPAGFTIGGSGDTVVVRDTQGRPVTSDGAAVVLQGGLSQRPARACGGAQPVILVHRVLESAPAPAR
jgi:hypothetical protein